MRFRLFLLFVVLLGVLLGALFYFQMDVATPETAQSNEAAGVAQLQAGNSAVLELKEKIRNIEKEVNVLRDEFAERQKTPPHSAINASNSGALTKGVPTPPVKAENTTQPASIVDRSSAEAPKKKKPPEGRTIEELEAIRQEAQRQSFLDGWRNEFFDMHEVLGITPEQADQVLQIWADYLSRTASSPEESKAKSESEKQALVDLVGPEKEEILGKIRWGHLGRSDTAQLRLKLNKANMPLSYEQSTALLAIIDSERRGGKTWALTLRSDISSDADFLAKSAKVEDITRAIINRASGNLSPDQVLAVKNHFHELLQQEQAINLRLYRTPEGNWKSRKEVMGDR